MLRKDSYCAGTSDSPVCDCGKAEESVEHFLLDCENYSKQREAMMNNVQDLVSETKSKKSLRITENLLLAPYCENIRKRDTLFIKAALFEFISCCKRNI